MPIKWVGVDAYHGGWVTVSFDQDGNYFYGVADTFDEIVAEFSEAELILVDMPIGLPEGSEPRSCESEARRMLGKPRSASVFRTPSCKTVRKIGENQIDYKGANQSERNATGVGLTQQSFAIGEKIYEVDVVVRDPRRSPRSIREVHPELLFWALNDCKSMQHRKRKSDGIVERLSVLGEVDSRAREIFDDAMIHLAQIGVRPDDVLDALAAALTAQKCHDSLKSIPEIAEYDKQGLRMEMVYCGCENTHEQKEAPTP